ncbi:MAG: quinone oxidoreductase [Rhodospirillaceae bacterium]|nr:quinone oxidoreductase [Rhodospirillaceae bacterium]
MSQTIKAIRIHQTGGPEEFKYEDVVLAAPGPGQVQVRHGAIGLNYIDVYMRNGLYPLPEMPSGIGLEAAGTVEAVGEGVTDFNVGDRVAYATPPPGAYAEARNIAAVRVVKVPDAIDDKTAAAMMLQGMTAQYLLRQTYRVQKGDTILIHAAAGGVGLIVCQWAKALGATVIGTVGSDEKAELAKANGCDHAIVYTRENFTERVKEITNGEGVAVVYDSIGKDTFDGSLDCLALLGTMVTFGNATGPVDPVSPMVLAQKGSLFLTRPTLFTYIAKRDNLVTMANELFDVVASGKVKIKIGQEVPLADAAKAHADLEARKTIGSTILIP